MGALILGLAGAGSLSAAAPVVFDGGVVNTADYSSALSPGILFSIFGSDLAPAFEKAQAFPLPLGLSGVSVDVVDGTRTLKAPLFFVSSGQVNALMPYEVTSTSVQIRLNTPSGSSRLQRVAVTPRTPRLLTTAMTGNGDAILVHADFTLVTLEHPARAGEVVVLFLTGLGAVSPAIASGQMANDGSPGKPLNQVTATVSVTVNQVPGTVFFAGLAPGFAGLYQVNFKVPETVDPGVLAISVEMGSQASQPTVRFSVAPATQLLTTSTIPVSGGAVQASGMTLSVPSGALSSPASVSVLRATAGVMPSSNRVTEVFEVAGLPPVTSAAMTLTLPLTSAPLSGLTPYVLLQELGGGELMLPAQVQGNTMVVTLPPRAGAPAFDVPQGRAAQGDVDIDSFLTNTILLAGMAVNITGILNDTTDTSLHDSKSKRFRLFSSIHVSGQDISALLDFLDASAVPFLTNTMGLTGLGDKIEIHLKPGLPGEQLCGGKVGYTSWNQSAMLVLREPKNTTAAGLLDLRLKATHLLAHALQNPKPRGKEGTRWVWFDEAVAASAADYFNVGPNASFDQAATGWLFAYHGLEYWTTTEDESALRVHGYGARRFLKYLANIHPSGWRVVRLTYLGGDILGKTTNLPVQALRSDLGAGITDISARWQAYLEAANTASTALAEHILPNGDIPFDQSRMQVLDGTVAATVTSSWRSMDLSESLFPVTISSTPPSKANLTLSITFSGTSDTIARFLRLRGTQVVVLGQGSSFGPVDANGFFEAGDQIWVVVMNRHAVSPFTTAASVSVVVQLKAPETPPVTNILDWIKTTQTLMVHVDGINGTCEYDETHSRSQCLSALKFVNADSSERGQIKPIQWNGRNFSYSGTLSYPGSVDDTHEISGSGTMSADGRTMESGMFYDKSISTPSGVVTIYELQINSVPYVSSNIGGRTYIDDLIYAYKLNGSGPVSGSISILRYSSSVKGKPWYSLVSTAYGSNAEILVQFQRPF